MEMAENLEECEYIVAARPVITYCPSVKVLGHTENKCFSLRDAFRLVAPFPGDLDGRFDCFSASVHGHHHIEVKIFCNELGKSGEDIIVEGS